jgi:hypothetical protein
MTERSKKISELTALTNASGDDLLIIVDQPGTANAATNKITVGGFFANVNTNTAFKQTVSVGANLTLNTTAIRIGNSTVNAAIVAGNITINGANVSTFNGSYINLSDKPSIPSDLSELTDNTSILDATSIAGLGDIRFEDNKIIGANTNDIFGSLKLVPNNSAEYIGNGHFIEVSTIDPSVENQVYIKPGDGVDLFLGNSTYYFGITKTGGVTINANTINIDNVLTLERVEESYDEYLNANGVFTLDCSFGHIFKIGSVAADFTPSLTNFFLATGYATSVTLILTQNSSPYAPTSNLQINGTNTTVSWAGGSITPNASKTDVVSYTILNKDGTYTILGQLSSYG